MSQEELSRARNLSGTLDMTLSDLVRALIQLSAPAISETPGSLIVIDRSTALGLRACPFHPFVSRRSDHRPSPEGRVNTDF